ncbi:TPA_asm: G [Gleditsia betacytorhabdovirus 1]|nr:TPA_asm: G [Gleditsia betacytorhabdovirus 1]
MNPVIGAISDMVGTYYKRKGDTESKNILNEDESDNLNLSELAQSDISILQYLFDIMDWKVAVMILVVLWTLKILYTMVNVICHSVTEIIFQAVVIISVSSVLFPIKTINRVIKFVCSNVLEKIEATLQNIFDKKLDNNIEGCQGDPAYLRGDRMSKREIHLL